MDKRILIINGPNLNLLGKREPHIYGGKGFLEYLGELKILFPSCVLNYVQTNHEGEIIDKLHQSEENFDAVIINPGGYTHTSISIRDAVSSIATPVIEVHISNIYERETFRHLSYISQPSIHTIVGEGLDGYKLAIQNIIAPIQTKTIKAIIHGKVQGVWYRQSTYNKALTLKLKGFVENKLDHTVYVEASGSTPNIDTFIKYLHRGPENAKVDRVSVELIPNKIYNDFEVRK